MKFMKKFLQKNTSKNCSRSRLKVCVAFSCGGHYVEAMQLVNELEDYDICYATPYATTTKELEEVCFLRDPSDIGVLQALIANTIISFKMLLKKRPDVIITTGAEIVIPLCYISKLLFGRNILFIETFARVTSPSFTGRVVYPIADIFLVQWKSLLKFYGKKAMYVGRVF
jgi:beta-1,4-N-acetylglucosaminyltransferase